MNKLRKMKKRTRIRREDTTRINKDTKILFEKEEEIIGDKEEKKCLSVFHRREKAELRRGRSREKR